MAGTVTTESKNHLLSIYFGSGWFIGLVDLTGFTAFAATDTASKITTSANPPTTNGWQESTIYSGNRPAFTIGTPSGGSVDNSGSVASFSITGTGTIHGAFVVNSNTPGGTSGILDGAGAFGSDQAVSAGFTLTVTATETAA